MCLLADRLLFTTVATLEESYRLMKKWTSAHNFKAVKNIIWNLKENSTCSPWKRQLPLSYTRSNNWKILIFFLVEVDVFRDICANFQIIWWNILAAVIFHQSWAFLNVATVDQREINQWLSQKILLANAFRVVLFFSRKRKFGIG